MSMLLGYKVVGDRVYYQHGGFMCEDGKCYSFNIINTDTQILGTLRDDNVLMLPESQQWDKSTKRIPSGLSDTLDRFLVEYDTFEDFKRNMPKDISAKDINSLMEPYYDNVISQLKSVTVGIFNTQTAYRKDEFAVIFFTVKGRVEMPIRLLIGEPSLIQERYYGNYTGEFKRFVEELGNLTGGIVWR